MHALEELPTRQHLLTHFLCLPDNFAPTKSEPLW